MDHVVDVLVIGAGAAGIAAARELLAAGRRVLLLEARRRPGGRAVTDASLGVPADLGAAWLHHADRNPWVDLVREYGFTLIQREPDWGPRSRVAGRQPSAGEIAQWQTAMGRYEALIEAAAHEGRDVALTEVLPDDAYRPRFDAIMTWAVGAESSQISTLDLSRYADSRHDWAVAEGLGTVVARAAADLPVKFGAVARRVDWRSSAEVRILTSEGEEYTAGAVIVTVPTSVLAEGALHFDPPLPDAHAEALDDLPLGVVNKVFFRFGDTDLPPEPLFTIGNGTTSRTAHYQLRPAGQPLAMAFFGGDLSRELEASGELAAFAREELARLFGADFTAAIRGELVTAWGADPFARGSYSAAAPGAAHQRGVLATPVSPRLLFAGEACSENHFGTVLGAWESGVAAARVVLDSGLPAGA